MMGENRVNSTLYKQMVGKLIYLTNTRPDILFIVGIVSYYMLKPQVPHLNAVKHIFKYLEGPLVMAYSTGLEKAIHYKDLLTGQVIKSQGDPLVAIC
jgi:hypothetical protein